MVSEGQGQLYHSVQTQQHSTPKGGKPLNPLPGKEKEEEEWLGGQTNKNLKGQGNNQRPGVSRNLITLIMYQLWRIPS